MIEDTVSKTSSHDELWPISKKPLLENSADYRNQVYCLSVGIALKPDPDRADISGLTYVYRRFQSISLFLDAAIVAEGDNVRQACGVVPDVDGQLSILSRQKTRAQNMITGMHGLARGQ